jgi:hypothetical protein
MELQAVTGQLYLINGALQDPSSVPGLLAQTVPAKAARGRQADFLFAHLTLSGQPEETATLAQDLLDSISNIFYQTPGSVTAALRKAIIETNKQLLGYNLRGSRKTHEGALTCAVLRGQELYMAQTGEAFALIGHNFGIERLPANPPNRITPMGRTAGLDIRYFHNWLQPGDMLMLADPRLAHLSAQALQPALIDTDINGSLDELKTAIGQNSGRVLVVEFTDEAPDYLPEVTRPSIPISSGQTMPPPITQPMREGTAISTAAPVYRVPTLSGGVPVDVETAEITARKATSQAAFGLSRATNWLANLLEKLRPPHPGADEHAGWALPAFLAIAIPILVTVIVTSVFLQRGRVVRFAEIKQEMGQSLALGRDAGLDADTAAAHYSNVLVLAAEAETLRPNDAEVERLRTEALSEMDLIEGIARLDAQLLYEFDPETVLTSIALGDELNGDIYLLDSINGNAYRVETDDTFVTLTSPTAQQILFNEQAVGSHIVGQVVDLMWRPRGQAVTRDGVSVLDSRGALITFFPNFADNRAVPLGLASDWVQPVQITSFNERLYILDIGSETIWRYFADGDSFTLSDDQRSLTFVEDADLDQVVDLAINSVDGSVILLYRDGRLRHYLNGRLNWSETNLANNGLEMPLIAPTSLKIDALGFTSSIFVADPGSGRLVQFSPGGTFLAQYKAIDETGRELFTQAADFIVLGTPLRVFVAAGNKLYVVTQQ